MNNTLDITLNGERLLESREACKRWNIHDSTLRRSIERLPEGTYVKRGKTWFVTVSGMRHLFKDGYTNVELKVNSKTLKLKAVKDGSHTLISAKMVGDILDMHHYSVYHQHQKRFKKYVNNVTPDHFFPKAKVYNSDGSKPLWDLQDIIRYARDNGICVEVLRG